MARKQGEKRLKVFEKTDYHCAYCGCVLTPDNWTIEHIIPKIKGGTNAYENLVGACKTCNGTKSGLSVQEYRQAIKNQIKELQRRLYSAKKFYYEFETL